MNTSLRYLLLLAACYIPLVICQQQRVPTLTDIQKINDPVLNEVFASSQARVAPAPVDPPRLGPQPDSAGPPPPDGYYSEKRGPSLPPLRRGEPLGPVGGQPDSSLTQLVGTGANVFATGANAFYRGAASLGQSFGIQQQPAYEVPLISQAANFFG